MSGTFYPSPPSGFIAPIAPPNGECPPWNPDCDDDPPPPPRIYVTGDGTNIRVDWFHDIGYVAYFPDGSIAEFCRRDGPIT